MRAKEPIETARLAALPGPMRKLILDLDAQLNPIAVYLFGSRATGVARPGSDLDLILVMPEHAVTHDCQKEVEALCSACPIFADVLLVSKSRFDDRAKAPLSFLAAVHLVRVR